MLAALKRLYTGTKCILQLGKMMSDSFATSSGIRQGASSSVFLFILFINDLIDYMKQNCVEEPLIRMMHCLLHDTVILSTNQKM